MILCLPPLDGNQSLRGYYLYRAHLACAVPSKIHFLHTTKPLSRLVKGSFKPLFVDEILSITVPIKARCVSEMSARSKRPISVSGSLLDNPGLLLKLSLGAGYSRLWAAEVSTTGLGGSGEILCDDTSGSSAPCDGEAGGGVSLSIISGGRSPKDELCGEGLRAGLQQICFGYYP